MVGLAARRTVSNGQVLRLWVQELHLHAHAATAAASEEDLNNDTCWCGKKYPCLDH